MTLAITIYYASSSNLGNHKKETSQIANATDTSAKSDYQVAEEVVQKLRQDKVDTILFFKRTCISCCDFYNIFWSSKGSCHVTTVYYNFDDQQVHKITAALDHSRVFSLLDKNYKLLKITTVKPNEQIMPDGTKNTMLWSHYCYAMVTVYTQQDSIITERILDDCFLRYASDYELPGQKKELNINYRENINSVWNVLLTTIEQELAAMPQTPTREIETFRTKENKSE